MDSRSSGLRPFVIFCSLVSALGALNNGFNTSALNIPSNALIHCPGVPYGTVTYYPNSPLPQCIPMSDWILGAATGMFAVGGLLGAMIASYMASKFGRRDSMIIMNVTFFIGAILLSLSTEPGQFAVGRIFVGIGSGFMTVVISMYIAEISPPKYRGALGCCLQLLLTVGILIIECIGLGLSSAIGWRVVVIITIVPAIIQMLVLPFCARSPRWLISQNRIDEARVQLMRLREGDVQEEFSDMILSLTKGGNSDDAKKTPANNDEGFDNEADSTEKAFEGEQSISIVQIFKIPVLAVLTLKMMVVHASSQLTGINAVMYYSTSIFENSFGDTAKYVTIGVSGLNIVITIIGLFLADRLGRKMLMYISAFGMCVWAVLMTIGLRFNVSALQVLSIYIFVGFYAIGLGVIPFVINSEVFPTYAVSASSSIALVINWLCNFIVGLIFPALQTACGPYVFLIFAGLSLAFGLFILFFVPETKQKSIDQLGRELGWYGLNPAEINNTKE
ncbi:Solute carrier 2, facilitated glucose transporter member 3 [Rhizopus stolonifer]|uniref:Solute carrier 2, facilitated glucose transporter member 3 n=1 Tax=Rhizopus stolonifer TaxID=4846 RepID=A0A367K4V4_RHIST|nr:Solute carrier 2, facilitated glucose transporter member 3 [Rhizopus stolonifer]